MREAASGLPRPAWRAPTTTPPSCSPTSSGRPGAQPARTVEVGPDERARRSTPSSRAGPPASRCSTSPAPPPSATSSSPSAPACSCRDRRPSCWPAGPSSRLASRSTRGARPVVVDLCTGLRRRRARDRDRGARGGRACRRARRRRPSTWAARNLAGSGVDLRHGDMSARLRRPRRHRRRRGLQPAVHPARGLRVGDARGARPRPAARAVLRPRRPRRDARRGDGGGPAPAPRRAWSVSSTPTSRARPRRACSRPRGRWSDVRDHADLAGRPRFVTARLAR